MTSSLHAEPEHQKTLCQQALLNKLQGGAATFSHGCEVTNKLIMWLTLQDSEGDYSFDDITKFIQENPSWPNQAVLKRRAEQAIDALTSAQVLARWFDANPPQTTDGAFAYLQALKDLGRVQNLKAAAKKAWSDRDFSKSRQSDFLNAYGSYLDASDDTARLERLLWADQLDQVQRLLSRLPADQHQMAEARLKFKSKKKSGVPSKYQAHEGVLYDQVRSLRKQKRFDEAAKLILKASISSQYAPYWWGEINYIAREFMELRRFKEAFQLIAKHNLTSGEPYAVAEWTSGWLNLRFLNDPAKAAKNFERLHGNVKSPISLGRAAYWAGRAYEGMQKPQEAARWYEKAAGYRTTYYGQLAAAKLQFTPHPALKTYLTDEQSKAQVLKLELMQALHLLSQLGKIAYPWTRPFVLKLAVQAKSDQEKHTLLDLIAKLVPHEAVWFAKKAGAHKHLEITQGYPHLPALPKSEGTPEPALSHAVAYQESRFDPYAISHAGAMGLMQLMPATARQVAKKEGISHVQSKLISDPKHNVVLGSHNLAHLLEYYNGSYILAIAAYNAGEVPVNRWLALFGDPRKGEIDVIDWIELIPYHETRNYVQRVLENLGPYRIVLHGETQDTIIEDLQR